MENHPNKDKNYVINLSKSIDEDLDQLWKAEVGAVEADRASGRYLRARNRIRKTAKWLIPLAPANEREKVKSEIILKRILLERYFYFLYKKLRLTPIVNRKRAMVKTDLTLIAEYFAEKGSWFNLQHCEMLAKRFDLRMCEIYSGTMTPPETHQGYHHLGYILAEMMGYRGDLANPKIANPRLRDDYLGIAEEIGINPEVWKLAYAIEKRFGKNSLTLEDKAKAKKAWNKCEYTLPMQMLLSLRGTEL